MVNAAQNVIGIITDRDICIALGTKNRRASELKVRQVMSQNLHVSRPDDDIHTTLNTMRACKVRRLPVVTSDGKLTGMLCASDVLIHARHDDGSGAELSYEDIVNTLRGIYWHHSSVCV